jgi:hypothetical protein
VAIPKELSDGLDVYRNIRNALHHDDGATFDGSGEPEFHLFPEQLENFFKLFCWIAQEVDQVKSTNVSPG